MRLITSLAIASLGLVACGGDDDGSSLECGDGTVEMDGVCLPIPSDDATAPTTSISPPAGSYVSVPRVVLTADEPATIYYTTDGSAPSTTTSSGFGQVEISGLALDATVKFFAVDLAGNTEALQEAAFALATARPAQVTGLTAVATSGDVTVSWDAPGAGIAEVIVVRQAIDAIDPSDGASYAVGDGALGGEVIFRGAGTEVDDLDVTPGRAVYSAYAIDAAGNYSRGAMVAVDLAVGPQTFTLTYLTGDGDLVPPSVSVSQPSAGQVSALIGDDASATSAEILLDLFNESTRVAYSPKLVVTNATLDGGAYVGALSTEGEGGGGPDGQLDGSDYFQLVPIPHGWAPGGKRSVLLSADTLVANQTLVLSLSIEADPMVITATSFNDERNRGGALVDMGTGVQVGDLTINVSGPGQDFGFKPGAFSPDGRTLYMGSRNSAFITAYDLVTMGEAQVYEVASEHGRSHVSQLELGQDGRTLYAMLVDGGHDYREADSSVLPIHLELVALDRITWTEVGRLRLATLSSDTDLGLRSKDLAISPDGTRMAIAVHTYRGVDDLDLTSSEAMGSVHIVDLATLTETRVVEFDAISVVGEVDPVVINPRTVAWVDDDTLIVGSTQDDNGGPNNAITVRDDVLAEIDADDGSVIGVDLPGRPRELLHTGDGPLIVGEFAGILRYNAATDEAVALPTYASTRERLSPAGQGRILVGDSNGTGLDLVDATTGETVWTMTTANDLYWILRTP